MSPLPRQGWFFKIVISQNTDHDCKNWQVQTGQVFAQTVTYNAVVVLWE